MNNYHIYAELGRGKGSVVYKGREKKTINYVAIKSVEKQFKNKVLNEVGVLYSLVHPNILRFLNWYETSKHIWLIVEYCTGGDLLAMLRLDHSMPEVACRRFAWDILNGLQFVHSKGFIYGDLKPSNILVNEYGTLLLCDFGLARKVMQEEDYQKHQQEETNKRGSPYYMSPELFYSDGIHSFASDLWAFGCLAYELATGRPPFYSKSLEEVVTHILEADPRPLCTNDASDADGDGATPPLHRFSREFEHLVLRCLEKDPARRITWPELRAHPFWRESPSRLPELDLPDQPVFTRLFMGEENGADADGPPSVGASANLNSTLRRSGPPDVLRLSSQAKRNRITEHTESVRASAAAASAVAPVASLRSVAPSSSSAAVVEDEIPENLDGTVADLTLPSYDVEVDFSSTQPTDTDSRRVAPLPPVAGAQPPPQPVSRPVTSNNSARLLREPTRSARPTAELDAMEAQLARLHAREEEEEDVEVDDDDEDEEDRPDDFEPPPEQDDDEDETWHPDGTATFSAHHALDDVDDEEESYAEAIALNPRSASGSARRRQEDAQEESEPRPSAFALARHTTPALRLPQANYGPSTQPGTPLAAVAARKGSAGASRLPVLAPRAATAATTSTSAAPARKPVIKTTSSTSSSSAATTTRTASRKKPASSSSSSSVTTSHRALTTPLATRTPGGSSTTSTASRTRSTSATTKPTSSSRPSPTDQRLAWPERERP